MAKTPSGNNNKKAAAKPRESLSPVQHAEKEPECLAQVRAAQISHLQGIAASAALAFGGTRSMAKEVIDSNGSTAKEVMDFVGRTSKDIMVSVDKTTWS